MTPMDQHSAAANIASKPPVRTALNVLALCFALSVLGRGLGRKLYGFSAADLRKLWLGPGAGGFGLFAGRACRRAGVAAGRPAVRPFRPPPRLFARTLPARRRVPDRRLRAKTLAVSGQPRTLRRPRHRLHRQRPELDPARPLVWPAAADRHGRGVFRDRRRRAGPAAVVAGADRPFRLARRLPDLRLHGAGADGAAAVAAVAAVLDGFADPSPSALQRISSTKAGRC